MIREILEFGAEVFNAVGMILQKLFFVSMLNLINCNLTVQTEDAGKKMLIGRAICFFRGSRSASLPLWNDIDLPANRAKLTAAHTATRSVKHRTTTRAIKLNM